MIQPESTYRPDDAALFGLDATSRIVAIQPITDRGADDSIVRIYRRHGIDSKPRETEVPFFPFFFLSDISSLTGFPRNRFRFQKLRGRLHFRHLVVFRSWSAYWDAVRHIERKTQNTEDIVNPVYLVRSPSQQYLMQSGRTLFKDMSIDDVLRMQLDIEVVSEHEFPNAAREDDAVVLVAMSDNTGWREIVGAPDLDENYVLRTVIERILERDPDVLEGHNIYGFDFPYLMERCDRHGIPFAIARDGSVPRTFSSSARFAERSVEFTALDISGRHVVDTYFQVMSYDVVKRNLPGYGLKEVARYFGLSPSDRTYVEPGDISRIWREDPPLLMRYAEDDVIETERLARHLSESAFYLTRMVPMPYGQVSRTGPASKIESLFVREYLRQHHSLPHPEWGSQTRGGYTDIFYTGVVGPIVYADVESLYPSIMLNYDIQPDRDPLKLFPFFLKRLTDLRLETRNEMQSAESHEMKSALDARQSAYKIVINSFYGYLGFSLASFNDFSEADRITKTGQEILKSMILNIRAQEGKVIEVDTDGVLFVPPPSVAGEDAERAFVASISARLHPGIRLAYEGRYRKMLSYKMKNYALLAYDGQLTFKGSSLVSRTTESFGRRFVRKAIQLLLHDDIDGLHQLYLETRKDITEHRWKEVSEFSRTETLKESISRYRQDVAGGHRTRSAAYELAIHQMEDTGTMVRRGDRVSYYIGGTGTASPAFESARPAREWDHAHPDENTSYYLRRLDEFAGKFEPFFRKKDFRSIFSPEDLFGFDAAGIRIQSRSREEIVLDSEGSL